MLFKVEIQKQFVIRIREIFGINGDEVWMFSKQGHLKGGVLSYCVDVLGANSAGYHSAPGE